MYEGYLKALIRKNDVPRPKGFGEDEPVKILDGIAPQMTHPCPTSCTTWFEKLEKRKDTFIFVLYIFVLTSEI